MLEAQLERHRGHWLRPPKAAELQGSLKQQIFLCMAKKTSKSEPLPKARVKHTLHCLRPLKR